MRNRGGGASSAAKQSESGEASGLIIRSRFGNAYTLGSDLIGSTDQSYQSTPGRRPRPRLETNLIGRMLYTPHWIGLDGLELDWIGSDRLANQNHATCCAACSRITDKNEIRNPEMRVCPPCSALLCCGVLSNMTMIVMTKSENQHQNRHQHQHQRNRFTRTRSLATGGSRIRTSRW